MNDIPSGDDEVSIIASKALSYFQKKLNKSSQFTFLDIGCGEGGDIDFISSNLDNLTMRGIDISSRAIKKAVELYSDKDNITFERMDWKELDDTQYDIVYMSGVYHFFNIANRNAFISKLKKILKSPGFFILSTLSSNDMQYYGKGVALKNDPNSFQSEYFLHFSSEDELREDFKFLKIVDLFEFFHKNYSNDTEYHTMWMMIGENI